MDRYHFAARVFFVFMICRFFMIVKSPFLEEKTLAATAKNTRRAFRIVHGFSWMIHRYLWIIHE